MPYKNKLIDALSSRIEQLRIRTSRPDALIQLSVLGLLTGIATGIVAVGFLLVIEYSLSYLLPGGQPEHFEALSTTARFLAPLIGSCLLILLFHFFSRQNYSVGVVHVLERLHYHQGYLQLRAFFMQFAGGAIALISGHSLGREGPGIHLGATIGSQLGQWLHLPNNAVRTLLACGSSAAIAASFNTPLAGVIFTMEVVVLEYSLASIVPVIIAAVSATAVFRYLLGHEALFTVPNVVDVPIEQIPFVIILGLVVGTVSAIFTLSVRFITQWTHTWSLTLRFLLAGAITGLIAIVVPQVMGIGYDTVNQSILGELGITLLCLILLAKLLTTSLAIGFGMPGGLIGPTLFLGATVGSLVALTLPNLGEQSITATGTYALIGMSAMLGATLQAPLTALVTVFELTASPNVIWPSMLAIVVSHLVTKQLFHQAPIYEMLLRLRGLDYRHDYTAKALHHTGIHMALDTDFMRVSRTLEPQQRANLPASLPKWIVIMEENKPITLLPGIDLSNGLSGHDPESPLDLMEFPAKRLQLTAIDRRSTLADADKLFKRGGAEALCVIAASHRGSQRLLGIVSKERFYSEFAN